MRVKPKGELPNSVRNPSAAMGKAETRTRGRGGGGGDGGGGGNPGYELPAPSPLPSLRDLGLAGLICRVCFAGRFSSEGCRGTPQMVGRSIPVQFWRAILVVIRVDWVRRLRFGCAILGVFCGWEEAVRVGGIQLVSGCVVLCAAVLQ